MVVQDVLGLLDLWLKKSHNINYFGQYWNHDYSNNYFKYENMLD